MASTFIIYRYESKLAKRFFQTAVAVTVWSIALSFLARLITAVAWYLLGSIIFKELKVPRAYIDAAVLVEYLLAFSAFVLLANYGWAKYNYLRYGRRERRRHPGYGLKNKHLSIVSNTSLAKIHQLQQAKRILLHSTFKEGTRFHVVR